MSSFMSMKWDADLLSMGKTPVSDLHFSTNVSPSPISVDQAENMMVDPMPNDAEDVHKNVLENASNDAVSDDIDGGPNHVEKVHEQGEQNIPPVEEVEEVEVRRSARGHIPSTKYPSSEYLLVVDEEPKNFQEVLSSKDKSQWLEAMNEWME